MKIWISAALAAFAAVLLTACVSRPPVEPETPVTDTPDTVIAAPDEKNADETAEEPEDSAEEPPVDPETGEVGFDKDGTDDPDYSVELLMDDIEEIPEEERAEAEAFLNDWTEKDREEAIENGEDPGFQMTYGIEGKFAYGGEEYYFVWARWLVEDEDGNVTHSSRVGELALRTDYGAIRAADALTETFYLYPNTDYLD